MASSTDDTRSTDEQIVGLVLAGEPDLFEHLMRRNNQRVYRAARAIVRDDREAEDVMQDAYVRAYEHLRDFDGRARFSTWITRIAVHEALARTRRSRRQEPLDSISEDLAMPSTVPTPEQSASDVEVRGVLERAIGALPDVSLMTNNPAKVDALRDLGVEVLRRVPIVVEVQPFSRGYLATKRSRNEPLPPRPHPVGDLRKRSTVIAFRPLLSRR